MSKELAMYNPIAPIWVIEITDIKEIKAIEAVEAVKAVKAKEAVLDKEGNIVSPAVKEVKAVKAVKAVEAKTKLITPEGYDNIVVSAEFVPNNDAKPGMYYFVTAGKEKEGVISVEELAKNYKAV